MLSYSVIMLSYSVFTVFVILAAITNSNGQSDVTLPFSARSLQQIFRSKTSIPPGRKAALSDVGLLFFGANSTDPNTYRFNNMKKLISDPNFDVEKPTVFYAYGYVEVAEDESVLTVVEAYIRRGGSNVLVVDWANLGFGNYLFAAKNVQLVGKELGRGIAKLVAAGMKMDGLHLIGHSLGSHLVAYAARHMSSKGLTVPRLTGLDPALPGFYPPLDILGKPMSPEDATFVDVIHTDGGKYGTPLKTGHADFWPNGGSARQPGCTLNSVPLTYEDFCSHWRSWRFYAESLTDGRFVARACDDYDTFLRGRCAGRELADMGVQAAPYLRGNFYLRTAASSPYALGDRGAE